MRKKFFGKQILLQTLKKIISNSIGTMKLILNTHRHKGSIREGVVLSMRFRSVAVGASNLALAYL